MGDSQPTPHSSNNLNNNVRRTHTLEIWFPVIELYLLSTVTIIKLIIIISIILLLLVGRPNSQWTTTDTTKGVPLEPSTMPRHLFSVYTRVCIRERGHFCVHPLTDSRDSSRNQVLERLVPHTLHKSYFTRSKQSGHLKGFFPQSTRTRGQRFMYIPGTMVKCNFVVRLVSTTHTHSHSRIPGQLIVWVFGCPGQQKPALMNPLRWL